MPESETPFRHTPVLLAECLEALAAKPGAVVLDATLGGGGHSAALAEAIRPGGILIGIDRDREALAAAQARLAPFAESDSIILIYTSFGNMETALDANSRTAGVKLDAVLFDLGVSSHQLDSARGFSFRRDEPLDMRMDRDTGPTAADYLRTVDARELTRVLTEYGEERWAHRIAARLVEQRRRGAPIETTAQLNALVEGSIPRAAWPKDIHVATRTYQALRIALNDELGQLEAGLEAAVHRLKPGGRVAVISFHSLEDRIVKRAFAGWSGAGATAPGSSPAAFLPREREPLLRVLTRKPIVPTAEETARNPRARSAKLRVAERLGSAQAYTAA
jgi:16S rRNA (cytosine1402-N4)-methyltransferase